MSATKRKVSQSAAAVKARVLQCPTPQSKRREEALRTSQKVEMCAICCSDAPAGKAVRLACSHGWYCEYCMKQHADSRLAAGDVLVPCPECRETIQESSLKQFLKDDVVARLHARSIQKAIASSSNLFTCPSPNCDMCVELDASDEAWLKKCPKCRKGSCLRCGAQPYHKGISCQMHALSTLTAKAKGAEMKFRKWMRKTGTKQCPGCKMGVTKEDIKNQSSQKSECHKMLCRNCGVKFCYKCLSFLTDSYTCGCSIDRHGFFNPVTKKMMVHIRVPAKKQKASAAAKNKATKGVKKRK